MHSFKFRYLPIHNHMLAIILTLPTSSFQRPPLLTTHFAIRELSLTLTHVYIQTAPGPMCRTGILHWIHRSVPGSPPTLKAPAREHVSELWWRRVLKELCNAIGWERVLSVDAWLILDCNGFKTAQQWRERGPVRYTVQRFQEYWTEPDLVPEPEFRVWLDPRRGWCSGSRTRSWTDMVPFAELNCWEKGWESGTMRWSRGSRPGGILLFWGAPLNSVWLYICLFFLDLIVRAIDDSCGSLFYQRAYDPLETNQWTNNNIITTTTY